MQMVGPGTDIELLVVTWSGESSGIATIGIDVDTLTDSSYVTIGTPNGVGGTITVN